MGKKWQVVSHACTSHEPMLTLPGLFLSDGSKDAPLLPDAAKLRFLSVVEVSRIPLYIAIGSPLHVETDNEDVETWFRNVLVGPTTHDEKRHPWWQTARPDSQLGVLLSVESSNDVSGKTGSTITEILVYATRYDSVQADLSKSVLAQTSDTRPTETELAVQALPLNSGLLCSDHHGEPTPPSSPSRLAIEGDAVFLPPIVPKREDVINELQGRKRKSASEFLDEATERRSKARRKGGEGVSAAASRSESQVPALLHRRSVSNSTNLSKQPRPLSRSPSVSSSRPGTALPTATARSSLSRVQSMAGQDSTDLATRNKESISRIVMAGMRLYGLSQRKGRKVQSTGTASPAVDVSFDEAETERKRDEEYKNVYHQTFKGTCFAFRATIEGQDLQAMSQAVRDMVDRLLELFCNNPLANGLTGLPDKLTPGGRKAFG